MNIYSISGMQGTEKQDKNGPCPNGVDRTAVFYLTP